MVARRVEPGPVAVEPPMPAPWYPPQGAKGDDWIHPQLRPHAVDIDQLTLDPNNARTHDRRNLDAIKGSLGKFGQRQLLVVQKQGMIVRAGNGRLVAMREMRWTRVAVLVVDEGDVAAAGFALADNRSAELGEWDSDRLAAIVRDLQSQEFTVESLGWSDSEIDALINSAAPVDPGPVSDPGGDGPSLVSLTRVQKEWVDKAVVIVREEHPKYTIGQAVEHVCRVFLGEEGKS